MNCRGRHSHKNDSSFPATGNFMLLQTTHHIVILAGRRENGVIPPGMQKSLTKLSGFVKPACPCQIRYRWPLKWMSQVLLILLEHYATQQQPYL